MTPIGVAELVMGQARVVREQMRRLMDPRVGDPERGPQVGGGN